MLTLPYPPSANRYWRTWRNRVVLSRDAREYKEQAWWEAKAQGVEPLAGEVAVTIHIYRPIKRGDLDNRLKVVIDALNGVAYGDDKQIIELHAFRHDDKQNPRVEIEVTSQETTNGS